MQDIENLRISIKGLIDTHNKNNNEKLDCILIPYECKLNTDLGHFIVNYFLDKLNDETLKYLLNKLKVKCE